jgi:hypothetical protein
MFSPVPHTPPVTSPNYGEPGSKLAAVSPPPFSPSQPRSPRHDRAMPKMRRHCRGLAVVRLSGRDFYLGKWGEPETFMRYSSLLAEWAANGRRLVGKTPAPQSVEKDDRGIDLAEIVERYLTFCQREYRAPDGRPTGEADTIRRALRPLVERFVEIPARDFGPLALKDLRQAMIAEERWARTTINRQVQRIRAMFRWAVGEELIPPTVYQALSAVRDLRAGKSEARETEPVRPVPQPQIDAVLPLLSRQVAAMLRIQLLTGARPGEVCQLRVADLDMSGQVWTYTPPRHKTQHHGKVR